METQKVVFVNKALNTRLAGLLRLPDGFDLSKNYPAVIVTGPMLSVKEQAQSVYASRLTEAGMKILEAANGTIEVRHPELPHIKTIDLCEIWGPPRSPEARLQNVTVFGGQVDRSPCGTGTSAKLAELWTRGEIQLHEPFVYESVIGTRFTGRALRETKVGDFPAIVPEITGSAFITGYSQFVIDEDDPVKYGFRLG